MLVDFEGTENMLLASSPFLVFRYIAMADGSISMNERMEFTKEWGPRLRKVELLEKPVDQAILHALIEQNYEDWETGSALTNEECLRRLNDLTVLIVTKMSPQERGRLVHLLLELAQDIAEASRAFIMVGKTVSDCEAVALRRLRNTLQPAL